MPSTNERLSALQNQLNSIQAEQAAMVEKLAVLRAEVTRLEAEWTGEMVKENAGPDHPPVIPSGNPVIDKEPAGIAATVNIPSAPTGPIINPKPFERHPDSLFTPYKKTPFSEKIFGKVSSSGIDFEKFIGENIISKIGIVILVIGVGIGTKYAIDKELLSPLARIILGYLLGAGILMLALRLKKNYENFSAIILSGAFAIFYLVTFAAYSFYGLLPQAVAFGMMVVFTVFTVSAALLYNRQWIALLGLVGAYAVPFLLSDGSGRVAIMFSYMTLLNLGILAVAIKRYWQILYYSAFAITWIIFLSWFTARYDPLEQFTLAQIFSTIFFLIFYATFLIYKLVEKRQFGPEDVILLLANSFLFFGLGFAGYSEYAPAEKFTGLFSLCNAMVHFWVALAIYRMKPADKNLFYLVSGLVLVFITISIPVQLNGEWVTLLWATEAALLFWIGRTKKVGFYEILSYPMMVIAVLSQVQDWNGLSIPGGGMIDNEEITPVFHIGFAIALMVCSAFAFLAFISRKYATTILNPRLNVPQPYSHFFGTVFPPAALIFLLYFTFREELVYYWIQAYDKPYRSGSDENFPFYPANAPAITLLKVWLLNYSLVFLSVWGGAMRKFVMSKLPIHIFLVLAALVLLASSTTGMYWLGELRDSVMKTDPPLMGISKTTAFFIRYTSFACTGLLLWVAFIYRKKVFDGDSFKIMAFDLLLHFYILSAGSSELITWLKVNQSAEFDKLGLSIFWGIYSLLLIGLGIFLKKQHLRIAAIVLFGITLIKLFLYDIAQLGTMSKTIVFISLGLLLLTISFLYNKYKHVINRKE